jgi:phage minor structural protein
MILLSGHSLTPDRRVPIEKHSLRLRERESEADITPADMGGIGTESWLLDDVEPGAGIVWRVASIRQEFATATPTVHLEHMINSLRDRIMFGEVDAATMSGRLGATTCTAQEAIEYILSQQSDWVLYSFDFDDVEGPYKFNGDTLYDALSHVSSTLDGAWWSYDFSVYPFRLSITNKASGVGSELIPGRNLSAITKTVDKSGMYTRFYPIGKDDLHITGDYVSKNESTYGVIAKVETDLSLETEDELTAWANERLRKHADPAVTVEVEGLELADATGEELDRMRLGRICRVPLSEFGVTIQERITELY